MDFTGIFQGLSMNYATGKQTASFELNEDAREAFQDLKGCEKLTIQIKKYRKKRSLDANAYYWVLVSKLGKVLDMANPEVHNIALIRYGQPWIIDGKSVFTTIPDTEDAENQVRYAVNYHLQPTSQVREGNDDVMYRTYRLLRGSHLYNTEEMARLIEKLNIYDAVEQSKNDARTGETPVVMHRKNRKEWLVTMPLDDWMKLYER